LVKRGLAGGGIALAAQSAHGSQYASAVRPPSNEEE
jgi:hypothetical protein